MARRRFRINTERESVVSRKRGGTIGEDATDRWALCGSGREGKEEKNCCGFLFGLVAGPLPWAGPVGVLFLFLFFFFFYFLLTVLCYLKNQKLFEKINFKFSQLFK
jgi:hypothetical protein